MKFMRCVWKLSLPLRAPIKTGKKWGLKVSHGEGLSTVLPSPPGLTSPEIVNAVPFAGIPK